MPGFLIVDIKGTELTNEEAEILRHPAIQGVILFSRNYASRQQLRDLVRQLKQCRTVPLWIAVDQEGGRVQRFQEGFTRLPSFRHFGELYEQDKAEALQVAKTTGWLMAAELLAVGVDLSFTPVLDLDRQLNTVIGDRSFHRDPHIVAALAIAFIQGMNEAGMSAVGKHFPGHGGVSADSHFSVPIDDRPFVEIFAEDIQPFIQLIQRNLLAGIMPAHVVYQAVDEKAAGFSPYWLQQVLRQQLGFQGTIFSDDLTMEGASGAGDLPARLAAAVVAGCDSILICNNPQGVVNVLDHLDSNRKPINFPSTPPLYGLAKVTEPLENSATWRSAVTHIERLLNEHTCNH